MILWSKNQKVFSNRKKHFSEGTHFPKYLNKDPSSRTMLSGLSSHHILQTSNAHHILELSNAHRFLELSNAHHIHELSNAKGQNKNTLGTKAIIVHGWNWISQLHKIFSV
jgi:hypothetical protein